jgi:chromosome partition protein MukE
MSGGAFERLEDVITSPMFPWIDVALRQGRHIDRDEGERYVFLIQAQALLEAFYARYACDLIHTSEGYFYLLPRDDQMGRRHLTVGEMLVGQALALLYLDPVTVEAGGMSSRQALMARLSGLIGDKELVFALNPRRKKHDERKAQENVRIEIARGLRGLAALGFVELVDDEKLRLRAPILRFADSVRGLEDPAQALARLIGQGRVVASVGENEEDES